MRIETQVSVEADDLPPETTATVIVAVFFLVTIGLEVVNILLRRDQLQKEDHVNR